MMTNTTQPLYSVQAACNLLGIKRNTYEYCKRIDTLPCLPEETVGRRKLYTAGDVKRLAAFFSRWKAKR